MNHSMPGLPVFPVQTPGVYTHLCALSQWCHLILCRPLLLPSTFPASGSFQMSQSFTSGGQSIGVSASTSVLRMNNQDWSPLGWTDWLSLQSKRLSRVFSNATVQKHQFFCAQLSSQSQLSHPYMTTGKTIVWLDGPLLLQAVSLPTELSGMPIYHLKGTQFYP